MKKEPFGEHKGTNVHEPAPDEMLFMNPSYHRTGTFSQVLCIAPVVSSDGDETVSFVSMISSTKPQRNTNYTQFWLTKEEVDIVIKALQESLEWFKVQKREELIKQIGCDYGK